MTPTYRTEAVLSEDGKLLLEHLPFQTGQRVEVTLVLARQAASPSEVLRGTVLRYDQPTAPIAEPDWDALK